MMGDWNGWCWLLLGLLGVLSIFTIYVLIRWKSCITFVDGDRAVVFDICLRTIVKLLDTIKHMVHRDLEETKLRYRSARNDITILHNVGIPIPVPEGLDESIQNLNQHDDK